MSFFKAEGDKSNSVAPTTNGVESSAPTSSPYLRDFIDYAPANTVPLFNSVNSDTAGELRRNYPIRRDIILNNPTLNATERHYALADLFEELQEFLQNAGIAGQGSAIRNLRNDLVPRPIFVVPKDLSLDFASDLDTDTDSSDEDPDVEMHSEDREGSLSLKPF